MEIKLKVFKNENTNKKTQKKFTSYTTIMSLDGATQYVDVGFKYDSAKAQITNSGLLKIDDKDINLSIKNGKYKLYVNAEKIDFTEFKKVNVSQSMFVLTSEKETNETDID